MKALFENLEGGATVAEFLAWFPEVNREQVETVLEHPQRSLAENDEIISALEARAPTLAGAAFAKAREQMLAAGQSVLHSEQGVIYRVEPSGVTTPVMRIDPPVPVEKGRKIKLR